MTVPAYSIASRPPLPATARPLQTRTKNRGMIRNRSEHNYDFKPRLTYSAVIHSLAEQLTQKTRFLHDFDQTIKLSPDRHQIALLSRKEIKVGGLLGYGNFSNVSEVTGFHLHEDDNFARQQKSQDMLDSEDKDDELVRSEISTVTENFDEPAKLRRNLNSSGSYAIKCLKPELLESSNPHEFLEAAADFVIEAKYLSKLNHPNIIKLRGVARGWESAFANGDYDSFFILVDKLDDILSSRISKWRHGSFPEQNTMENKLGIALQIASALTYLADRQLMFRDLKPQNIGLQWNEAGKSFTAKLFDFGFCRELPVEEQGRDDMEVGGSRSDADKPKVTTLPSGETVFLMSGKGTRRYMAPEVLLLNRYNLKADTYSFAMVCWELLTLHKPFGRYTKEQHTQLVCEGGDRPPLEASTSVIWTPPASVNSPTSSAMSSMQTTTSDSDDSIDLDSVMTEPIRDLLRRAWHQDVSQRLTMKEVYQSLREIVGVTDDDATNLAPPNESKSSDLSNTSFKRRFMCHSPIAEYTSVRELVIDFTADLQHLPFLHCFGNELVNNEKENMPIISDPPPTAVSIQQSEMLKTDPIEAAKRQEKKIFSYNFPRFRTLVSH